MEEAIDLTMEASPSISIGRKVLQVRLLDVTQGLRKLNFVQLVLMLCSLSTPSAQTIGLSAIKMILMSIFNLTVLRWNLCKHAEGLSASVEDFAFLDQYLA